MNLNEKPKTSKFAVFTTVSYLFVVIASLVIMMLTVADTAMSGIFLVMVTMPWPLLLTRLQEISGMDSMVFNTCFLAAGGILNSVLIFLLLSSIMNRLKK